MKGGITQYNKEISAEKRKENARRAGIASGEAKRAKKTIKEFARLINEARAPEEARQMLTDLGLEDNEELINAALIPASVFRAAVNGDMKAVEKWEKYVGQYEEDTNNAGNGSLLDLIGDLKITVEKKNEQ